MPWKNGGGSTRELARHPAHQPDDGTFDWRLSVADVAADGPFSSFPGLDRILVLLSGNGMALSGVGTLRAPLDRCEFPGETPVHAVLLDGPTRDLNLMWRRDRWRVGAEGALRIDYVVAGSLEIDGHALGEGDVAVSPGGVRPTGDGIAVHFLLSPVDG